METINKEFTLIDIKTVAEKVNYLLSIEMKAGMRYKIDQWGKPFTTKYKDIITRADELILKFCNDGETTVPQDKTAECSKELNEFYLTKDSVEFEKFEINWISDIVTKDITILHQFMNV